MTLAPGMHLGPYEILSPLGAGGMGQVYRARDSRLGRDVAVKVLPPSFASDPESLKRFELEARAEGVLNHPNVLAIYDVGTHEGSPYVVSELLEGETLRVRMETGGALPSRKALEYAICMAEGLAAAHEKGVIHRDLKPENVFITKDGRLKILDFGLAKLTRPAAALGLGPEGATASLCSPTQPGTVLGTVGYMSPEQVRGQATDHRSDIFSFGTLLYEMLAGRRAFKGDSAVETMNAILKEDPVDLQQTTAGPLPPALDLIVRHCLEKTPEERFQSARDLAFHLEAVTGVSSASSPSRARMEPLPRGKLLRDLAAAGALVAAAGLGFLGGLRGGSAPLPSYRQLTFRQGAIPAARFAPDGQTVVYGASWGGKPVEIFTARPESPESRSLGLPAAGVFSISVQGELAIAEGCRFSMGSCHGTLARMPLSGGAPREILEDVHEADWSPDGQDVAVVHHAEGKHRIEYPVGRTLYETTGWISQLRFSLKGDVLAFLDHPRLNSDEGTVQVVDLSGKRTVLTQTFSAARGLAWTPAGEIWFTAATEGRLQAVRAVTPRGRLRIVMRALGAVVLHDVSRDGHVLLSRETFRGGLMGLTPGGTHERDLSWFDWSTAADLSADGKTLLFSEQGEGTQATSTVYLRGTNGEPAVRLGEGRPFALSPDGKWVLCRMDAPAPHLALLPTGPGAPRSLEGGPITEFVRGSFFPGGEKVLILGSEGQRARRCYVLDLSGERPPRALTPDGQAVDFAGDPVSPDGSTVAAMDASQRVHLYPVSGAAPRSIPGLPAGNVPLEWSADARFLFVYPREEMPVKLYRVEIATGRREVWRELMPPDATGIVGISSIDVSADGKSYVYSFRHRLSELYLVEGLR